mmetsp:Transcript_24720/g.35272  ORF Transcript_24720/g.35272 Transcript_24720/m.35272 type:complete len:123 (-) Transcript_24720:1064-1432(-)
MSKGSCMQRGQGWVPVGTVKTMSASLYSCLCHSWVMSRGQKEMCIEFCRFIFACRSSPKDPRVGVQQKVSAFKAQYPSDLVPPLTQSWPRVYHWEEDKSSSLSQTQEEIQLLRLSERARAER